MSVIVPQAYQHLPNKQVSQNLDMGGWSFLQYLSETKGNILQNREDDITKKTTYIHPIEKRSVTKLSLEMCTESLGTENGSESGDEISLLAFKATDNSVSPDITTKPYKEINFMSTRQNGFPPPLNSVDGFNGSRIVRSYKEDGRLVVQAVRICPQPRCFVSERCEGRLRLCLAESYSHDEDEELQENETEIESREEDEDEDEEKEEDEEDDAEEGIVDNNENLEGIIGNEKLSRRPERRCEATTMLNWKPQQFWVTT